MRCQAFARGNQVEEEANLVAPTTAKTLSYLDSAAWSQKTLLKGENGLAALTFCEVPITPAGKAP